MCAYLRFSGSVVSLCVVAAGCLTPLALTAHAAFAQAVVPNAIASVEGDSAANTLDSLVARTYQTQIAASQLTAFMTGSQIGGLSFRLDNFQAASTVDSTFASYQVTLSQAANSINNFSPTFANNIGNNSVTVYNNALTFTSASFADGATGTTPNAFGPSIFFSTPYTYQGGDLVITIRHSGAPSGESPFLDSVAGSQGYGTAIVGQFSTAGQNATTATNLGNATVIRLNPTAAAPEPSTLPLLGMGLTMSAGMVSTIRRRKAKGEVKQAA